VGMLAGMVLPAKGGSKGMIDRTKTRADAERKPLETAKPERTEASAKVPFTLYGSGGRAWVERSWSASPPTFSNNPK
jgi:hypothetical protein